MVDISTLMTWKFVAVVGLATLISVIIRINDVPKTFYTTWQDGFEDITGKLAAAFLIAWAALEAGTDIYSALGFVIVIAGAVGGISAFAASIGKIQTLLSNSKPTAETGPPVLPTPPTQTPPPLN